MTLLALQKLLMMRDSRIESLMVIGFNPSHSNINSEVNAPFKILSTLLRFIDNEEKGLNQKNSTSLAHRQGGYDDPEESKGDSNLNNYKMKRVEQIYGGGQSERLDTMEGYNDLYDQEEDDNNSGGNNEDFNNMNDDDSSEGENPDEKLGIIGASTNKAKKAKKALN